MQKGVLLAKSFGSKGESPDVNGWWVSEKLDGVRAYWNGKDFYSRNGLKFDAPAFFKEGLPFDTHLDGELWTGRGEFEKAVGIVKYHKGSMTKEWAGLNYMMFDAPNIRGKGDLPFEERIAYLKDLCAGTAHPHFKDVKQVKCTGVTHLQRLLQDVTNAGGEGLMLRQPHSMYERVRSKSLLKVKTMQDAEAKVIGHSEGKNRLQGMLGALVCEVPLTGAIFEVGSGFKDHERKWLQAKREFPCGTVITYQFQNWTAKGKPRFPVFLRKRLDKTWQDVCSDAHNDTETNKTIKSIQNEDAGAETPQEDILMQCTPMPQAKINDATDAETKENQHKIQTPTDHSILGSQIRVHLTRGSKKRQTQGHPNSMQAEPTKVRGRKRKRKKEKDACM